MSCFTVRCTWSCLNRPGFSEAPLLERKRELWDVDRVTTRRSYVGGPPELRGRTAQTVGQVRPEYPSDWPAICAVAEKLGIGTAETLRTWAC